MTGCIYETGEQCCFLADDSSTQRRELTVAAHVNSTSASPALRTAGFFGYNQSRYIRFAYITDLGIEATS